MRFLMWLVVAACLWGQTATISDTLTATVGGGNWTGRISVTLNAPGGAQPLFSGTTSLAGWASTYCVGVSGSDCSVTTAAGKINAVLWPNDSITPAGTSYSVRFVPTRGTPWVETWTVEAADTKLYQIRSTTTPTPTTTLQASQLVLAEGRIPYGGTLGTATSESYFTHTPIPASPVAGNAFTRFSLTGATAPSGEYLDSNYTSDFTVRRTVTAPSNSAVSGETNVLTGQLIRMAFTPSVSWNNSPTLQTSASGTVVSAAYPSGATNAMYLLSAGVMETFNRGSGAVNTQRGLYVGSTVTGASNITFVHDGINASATNSGTGTVANARGVVSTAGPADSGPGTMTSLAVWRGTAYTYAPIITAYGYRMTRSGGVNPSTAWGISEETGWPSRFNGRLAINKLTDDGSSALQVAGRIQANLETPASSSASCVAGQMVWDASYLYVCVATNTWKRKLLDSF